MDPRNCQNHPSVSPKQCGIEEMAKKKDVLFGEKTPEKRFAATFVGSS
jgi:hypothetical protein